MKRSLEEHAERFSAMAVEYDEQAGTEYLACADLVIEHADPAPDDVVLDLGTGTGAIALALADAVDPDAGGLIVGRDISEGMMAKAEAKAESEGFQNLEFGRGTFREPDYDGNVDVITSNFALHHLSDEEKREAIEVIADLEPRKFVLGDVMFFGEPDPEEPFYSPEVDDPATVGTLADAFTDAGFSLTAVERVHDQVGVLVAERTPTEADGIPGDDADDETAADA